MSNEIHIWYLREFLGGCSVFRFSFSSNSLQKNFVDLQSLPDFQFSIFVCVDLLSVLEFSNPINVFVRDELHDSRTFQWNLEMLSSFVFTTKQSNQVIHCKVSLSAPKVYQKSNTEVSMVSKYACFSVWWSCFPFSSCTVSHGCSQTMQLLTRSREVETVPFVGKDLFKRFWVSQLRKIYLWNKFYSSHSLSRLSKVTKLALSQKPLRSGIPFSKLYTVQSSVGGVATFAAFGMCREDIWDLQLLPQL